MHLASSLSFILRSVKNQNFAPTEPYRGSDAYETHDGLIVAMVSIFKGASKFKTAASSTGH
jgi:hypothetical protein